MVFLPPPSFEIPSPPVEAPLHGLRSAAYVPDLSGVPESERDRWTAGISFLPNPITCADHVTPWMGWTDDPEDKPAPGTNIPYSTYHSFVLTYSTTCNALPGRALDESVQSAIDALDAGTGQAVESVFWGPGSAGPLAGMFPPIGGNFSLSSATPLVTGFGANPCNGIVNRNPLTGDITPLSPKQALLALSQALGNCGLGARGMIHAPIYLAEDWAGEGRVKPVDDGDYTSPLVTIVRGDYVVGGSGYSGIGPEGHVLQTPADGHAWAYATGPVGLLMTEPRATETTLIDHRTNLHNIIVERTVAIAASSSCLFAAYVDVA